jgi:hypothetical protein
MFPWKKVRENCSLKKAIEASSSDYHQLKDDEVELKRSKMIKNNQNIWS